MRCVACPFDELVTIIDLSYEVNHPEAVTGKNILSWRRYRVATEAVAGHIVPGQLGLYLTDAGAAIIIGSGSATASSASAPSKENITIFTSILLLGLIDYYFRHIVSRTKREKPSPILVLLGDFSWSVSRIVDANCNRG